MSCWKRPVVLAIWLVGFLLWISPLKAGTIYQNFTNNSYNTKAFFLWPPPPPPVPAWAPTAAVTDNRLELTVPYCAGEELAGAGFGNLGNLKLSGDYDIQVDFNLLTWNAENGVNAGIITPRYEVSIININLGLGVQNYYLVSFIDDTFNGFHPFSTSDNSGKLRLNRIGNTVSGYFWQDKGWQLIASNTMAIYGEPISFYVGGYVGNRSAKETKVSFDNLRVTNAVFPSALPPLNLLIGN